MNMASVPDPLLQLRAEPLGTPAVACAARVLFSPSALRGGPRWWDSLTLVGTREAPGFYASATIWLAPRRRAELTYHQPHRLPLAVWESDVLI